MEQWYALYVSLYSYQSCIKLLKIIDGLLCYVVEYVCVFWKFLWVSYQYTYAILIKYYGH